MGRKHGGPTSSASLGSGGVPRLSPEPLLPAHVHPWAPATCQAGSGVGAPALSSRGHGRQRSRWADGAAVQPRREGGRRHGGRRGSREHAGRLRRRGRRAGTAGAGASPGARGEGSPRDRGPEGPSCLAPVLPTTPASRQQCPEPWDTVPTGLRPVTRRAWRVSWAARGCCAESAPGLRGWDVPEPLVLVPSPQVPREKGGGRLGARQEALALPHALQAAPFARTGPPG